MNRNNVIKHKFMVIGRRGCPYFENTKKFLKKNNLPVIKIHEIEKNTIQYKNLEKHTKNLQTYKQIKNNLPPSSHFTTPKIFLGNLYIGGFDDLVEYINDIQKYIS